MQNDLKMYLNKNFWNIQNSFYPKSNLYKCHFLGYEKMKTGSIKKFFKKPSPIRLAILAMVVGIGGGIASVIFHMTIDALTFFFFRSPSSEPFMETIVALPWYLKLLIPALGGFLVGLIITKFKIPEIKGHGVPEVMDAIESKKGNLNMKVAPLTFLTSSITIASGGSAGKEGPIVQIGSSIGSSIARFFNLDTQKKKLFLVAGAAAGIGGTFNAPLAGVIFGLEVLLRKIRLSYLPILLIASFAGTLFANIVLGFPEPMFSMASFSFFGYYEVFFWILLGITAIIISFIYIKSLYSVETLFEKIKIPYLFKPVLGGLLLGVVAFFIPYVYGPSNYIFIEEMLTGLISLELIILIIAAKIIATSLTLGSGATGGIFAPSLFMGTALGMGYGLLLQKIFPAIVSSPASYAAIGIGAVFAAAAHAPLTASIIIIEMSGNPAMVIPVVITCFTAGYIAKNTQKTNIYTEKIRRKKKGKSD